MIWFPELIWQSVKACATWAWSATICLLALFDVLAKASSRIRLRFNDRLSGVGDGEAGSGTWATGVWAGQGLSNGREDMA